MKSLNTDKWEDQAGLTHLAVFFLGFTQRCRTMRSNRLEGWIRPFLTCGSSFKQVGVNQSVASESGHR